MQDVDIPRDEASSILTKCDACEQQKLPALVLVFDCARCSVGVYVCSACYEPWALAETPYACTFCMKVQGFASTPDDDTNTDAPITEQSKDEFDEDIEDVDGILRIEDDPEEDLERRDYLS